MKFISLGLLALLMVSGTGFAEDPKNNEPEVIAKLYDFNKPEDRYRWYEHCRSYINNSGGLDCKPGIILTISKDGSFKTNGDRYCENSVAYKHFPLPYNYTGESVSFPIKGRKGKPLTPAELDEQIFKIPAAGK